MAITVAAIIFFFFFRSSGVYNAIPKSAVAVIEVNNWTQLADKLNTTATGNELKKTVAAQKLLSEIVLMQELLNSDKSLKEAIGSTKTVASVHLISAVDYDFLFTVELSGVNDNTILNRIQSSPKIRSVKVRIFKNQKIVDVILKDGKQLSFAKLKDVLAFSFTSFLTENSMTATLTGESLENDKNFKSVRAKLSPEADLSLYFNFQKADVIFPVALRFEKIPLLNDLNTCGTWGQYTLSFSNDKMELDGNIATTQKALPSTENIFSKQLQSIIPAHAAYVQFSRLDTANVNSTLINYFRNWMGGTKAFAILEPFKEDFIDQNVFVISSNSKGKAIEDLKRLIAADGTTAIAVDTFLDAEIYNLKDGSAINQLFGNSLVEMKNCFFCVKENAVIFCNNPDVLKLLLEKISKGETLDKDKNFANTYFSRFGMNSSIQYLNLQRSDLLLRGMIQQNSSLGSFLASFNNVFAVSNATCEKISSHLTFSNNGEAATSSGLLWKTKLQTISAYTPQIVLNSNTSEQEIFTQDTANNIYLISKSGEILFSKNIDEPILGKVTQIDYYNNGKQQYIFNSARHVFIVDRLGNDVASYPLRLSAVATSSLALSKTRYYIPCNNGSIYGYELNGRPVTGWSPKGGIGIINRSLQCFSTNKNDFVIMLNVSGKLMLFDTKGNLKWSVDNLPATNQNFSVISLKDEFKLLKASSNQLTEISADGNDNIKPLIDSANCFAAVSTSDSTYTYYFSTGNQIRAYGSNDEFQSAISVNVASISSLQMLNVEGKKYLLAVDESSKQFFVYDTSLKAIASFNYSQANSFAVSDLFNRNELTAITTDALGNVSCFRIK